MQIDDQVGEVRQPHDRGTEADGRIERTARDGSDGEGADHDREADGQSVERVAGRPLGRGRVQDDVDQGEREEELGEEPGRGVIGGRARSGRQSARSPSP